MLKIIFKESFYPHVAVIQQAGSLEKQCTKLTAYSHNVLPNLAVSKTYPLL